MDPNLLQQLMSTNPNFPVQLEQFLLMYQPPQVSQNYIVFKSYGQISKVGHPGLELFFFLLTGG